MTDTAPTSPFEMSDEDFEKLLASLNELADGAIDSTDENKHVFDSVEKETCETATPSQSYRDVLVVDDEVFEDAYEREMVCR